MSVLYSALNSLPEPRAGTRPLLEARRLGSMEPWAIAVGCLLIGYTVLGRSFAYLGVPPAKIFIAEITLALFVFFRPRALFDTWVEALLHPLPHSPFAWSLLLFLVYGICEVVRGVAVGYQPLPALQNLVLHVYPLFFFTGAWVGRRNPDLLARVMHMLTWATAIYGLSYILFLNKVAVFLPGTTVPVFGQAGGHSLALLWLISLESRTRSHWVLVALNAFLLLALQIRGEWLAFFLGLLLWSLLSGKMRRFFVGAAVLLVLLGVGYVTDFSIPSPASRGGVISTREILGRALSAIEPGTAQELTPRAGTYSGTISWRTIWWRAIWDSVHESNERMLFGHGYGFPMSDLVPYAKGSDIRTPHNIFFYVLGYDGWVGVALFAFFQFCLAALLWKAYRDSAQPLGIAVWAMAFSGALFGNVFETPAGAVTSYLLFGLLTAALVRDRHSLYEHIGGSQLVPTTRW
jgi:hypothetical protein